MRCFFVIVGLLALSAASAPADEPVALQEWLQREITGPVLPAAEAQRYCEARIPPMPPLGSADQWQAEADRLRAAVLEKIVATIPVRRLGHPDEIGSIVAWLASDESGFSTGADFSLNGGLHMG